MSMDGIRVNHAGLDQASADLANGVKEIDNRLNHLEQELAPLRNDWTGQAQVSYQQAKAKWDQAMQEMTLLLQQASQGVDSSNSEYKAADARGANRF